MGIQALLIICESEKFNLILINLTDLDQYQVTAFALMQIACF
jgi:hypothetical protein